MRHLLHLGLFALALTVVSVASADDDSDSDSDYERDARVIVVRNKGPHKSRPVRRDIDPSPVVYHSPYAPHHPGRRADYPRHVYYHRSYELAAARQNVREQEQDLERIVRIANRWNQATANRNPHAQRKAELRLDSWIEREIIESRHEPYDKNYVRRLRTLRRELNASDGWYAYGRGWHVYGRGWHRNNAYKARILDELIELSERQVYRAHARLRHPGRFAVAYR